MTTMIGGSNLGFSGAALPYGKTAEQQAADDLAAANASNAFKIGGNGQVMLASQPMNLGMSAPQPAPAYSAGPYGQPGAQGYTPNPYLDQMAAGITGQMNDNWTRNQLPSIRSGAMAAGGFGGSRQGVVEANGLNDMNRSLGQNLANLYGSDYNNAMGRNLQQQSINNSYDLGLRSSDLGFSNLDANINQQNFNNNLAGANFGMGVYGMMNGMNQQGINSGTQMQNTPLNYFNQFNGNTNATGGMGGTQTGTQGTTSNGLSQGLGLGLAGGDFLTKYFTAV